MQLASWKFVEGYPHLWISRGDTPMRDADHVFLPSAVASPRHFH
jgi:hypothetical protein